MQKIVAFFAASRYWQDKNLLESVFEKIKKDLGIEESYLLIDCNGEKDLPKKPNSTLIIVPMSGAVQKNIVDTASMFEKVIIYPAYISGNADVDAEQMMLENNAAPTTMDCWAVLRQEHGCVKLALDKAQLE